MRKLLELFRRAFGVTALQEELRHLGKRLAHFNDTATTEIYTLSLFDPLPI